MLHERPAWLPSATSPFGYHLARVGRVQFIGILKAAEAGAKTVDLARRHVVSKAPTVTDGKTVYRA